MSFPSTPLRFAGDWNAVTTFVFGEVVLTGTPAVAYACGVQSSLNIDPSVQPSTDWFPFPPDAVAGVTSLNTLTGALTLAAGTGISLTPVANTITIANTSPASASVTSLNTLQNVVTLTSPDSSVGIAESGQAIQLSVSAPFASFGASASAIVITAIDESSAQSLISFVVTPTFVTNMTINAVMSFEMSTPAIHDLSSFIAIDGVRVGLIFPASGGGTGHYLNCSCLCTGTNQSVGNHTIELKVFADTTTVFLLDVAEVSVVATPN
jgi:hypothetical protein